ARNGARRGDGAVEARGGLARRNIERAARALARPAKAAELPSRDRAHTGVLERPVGPSPSLDLPRARAALRGAVPSCWGEFPWPTGLPRSRKIRRSMSIGVPPV